VPTSARGSEPVPAYVSMKCRALALAPGLLPPGDAAWLDDLWAPRHLWVTDACFPGGQPLLPLPQAIRDWRDAYGGVHLQSERVKLERAHAVYYRLTPGLYAYFLRNLKPGPSLDRVTAAACLTGDQRREATALAVRRHLPAPSRPPWPSGWGIVLLGDPYRWDGPRERWHAAREPPPWHSIPATVPTSDPAMPPWFNATSASVLAAGYRERGLPVPNWLAFYLPPCEDDFSGWLP
jgi:hypothetical protein